MTISTTCKFLIALSFCTAGVPHLIWAQKTLSSNIVATQREIWFDQVIGVENSGLINGQEYIIPMQGAKTHPFFGSREITFESITIAGQRFGNVSIMYDIYSDILIIRHREKNGLFTLIQLKEDVESFSLYGHSFKKITTQDGYGNITSAHWYDVLLEGRTVNLIVKRKKEIYMLDSKPEYRQEDEFYFLIGGQLFPVIRKKNIHEIFKIHEDQVKDYIKMNGLDVRTEEDLIKVAKFCDSLNKENK